MLIFGFDPGKNGAWGAINSNGKFHFCGDMLFDDERFLSEKMWEEICIARDGQDCQVVVEQVHSMPRDGVRQAFAFGTAYGIVIAIAQRLHCPFHFVSPQRWKRDMELTSDKEDCRMKAISLFPEGYEHLSKKKHHNRAEALLLAEWLRRQQ
jgi:crossover junction endodeoxyribonuclease RuvC